MAAPVAKPAATGGMLPWRRNKPYTGPHAMPMPLWISLPNSSVSCLLREESRWSATFRAATRDEDPPGRTRRSQSVTRLGVKRRSGPWTRLVTCVATSPASRPTAMSAKEVCALRFIITPCGVVKPTSIVPALAVFLHSSPSRANRRASGYRLLRPSMTLTAGWGRLSQHSTQRRLSPA